MSDNKDSKIEKLAPEVVNQIAAGEVIERPSSILKELLDNAIDAGADHIKIEIDNGGIDRITVADNGTGIPQEQLASAFEAHSTSKLKNMDDLNTIRTMGFRGEALSTIVAISKVTVIAKTASSDAYRARFNGIEIEEIEPAARDQGTTITATDIFYNLPARRKFLKSDKTEYRKILEIMTPYLILYPNIKFEVKKDGVDTFNLPAVSTEQGELNQTRIEEVFRSNKDYEFIELFSHGAGVKISGYITHPRAHAKSTNKMFVFINGRPINDRGVIRAVLEGYGRYIPKGEKVPFLVNIDINNELVDINVHPRKEEVRFVNPYRVYTYIEKAVSDALSNSLKDDFTPVQDFTDSRMESFEVANARLGAERSRRQEDRTYRATSNYDGSLGYAEPSRSGSYSVSPSSLFDDSRQYSPFKQAGDQTQSMDQGLPRTAAPNNVHQIFLKYLLIEFDDELWVIDQHAAAERITFERLLSHLAGETQLEIQNLLVAASLELDDEQRLYLEENLSFFKQIGFDIRIASRDVEIHGVPSLFISSDIESLFEKVFELSDDTRDLQRNYDEAKEDLVATIACHNSIRTNQKLTADEIVSQYNQLAACDNPYSCPHGRPVVWKLTLDQIDKNFDRTY